MRLRDAGMPVDEVTAITSLLVLPWALKFLWAPLVDAVRTPVWGLRSWILSAQFLMGLPLLALMWVDLASAVGLDDATFNKIRNGCLFEWPDNYFNRDAWEKRRAANASRN